jgi:hypothetical protein
MKMEQNNPPALVRLSEGLGRLAEIYERLCEDTDPIRHAVRQANAWGRAADALEAEALASGAMRGEVCVMLRYQCSGFGMKMTPFLK